MGGLRLKTPKRYQTKKRRRYLFRSWRWLRNLVLIGLFALFGYAIITNPAAFRSLFNNATNDLRGEIEDLPMMQATVTPLPDVSDALVDAQMSYGTGDMEDAIQAYRTVITGAPNDVDAHFQLAYLLLITSNGGSNQVKMNEALEVAEMAVNADPESPKGWAIKAMAMLWAERYGEAIAFASQALELDSNYVMAQAFLAQAYWDTENSDLAQAEIDDAVEYLYGQGAASDQTIAQVFRTQGYILDRLLERDAAIAAYQRALEAAPNHTYIVNDLAVSLQGNNQVDEAAAVIQTALDGNPRDPSLLFQQALIQIFEGQGEEAQQTLQRCIESDPDNPDCLTWLGGLQFYAGNYVQAIPNLELAISSGTRDPEAWFQLGRSHARLLQCNLAIPIYREGLIVAQEEEDPDTEAVIQDALADCNGIQ